MGTERISVAIVQQPSGITASFQRWAAGSGWTTWDVAPWKLPPGDLTEAAWLNELYAVVCEFIEKRA